MKKEKNYFIIFLLQFFFIFIIFSNTFIFAKSHENFEKLKIAYKKRQINSDSQPQQNIGKDNINNNNSKSTKEKSSQLLNVPEEFDKVMRYGFNHEEVEHARIDLNGGKAIKNINIKNIDKTEIKSSKNSIDEEIAKRLSQIIILAKDPPISQWPLQNIPEENSHTINANNKIPEVNEINKIKANNDVINLSATKDIINRAYKKYNKERNEYNNRAVTHSSRAEELEKTFYKEKAKLEDPILTKGIGENWLKQICDDVRYNEKNSKTLKEYLSTIKYVVNKLNFTKEQKEILMYYGIIFIPNGGRNKVSQEECKLLYNLLDTLPYEMCSKIKVIMALEHAKKEYEYEAAGWFHHGFPNMIYLRPLYDMYDTINPKVNYVARISHELAHLLEDAKHITPEQLKNRDDLWKKSSHPNDYVSTYARKNSHEDFAETFAEYITDTKGFYIQALKKAKEWNQPVLLKKFALMTDIFKFKNDYGIEHTYDFKINSDGSIEKRSFPIKKQKIKGKEYYLIDYNVPNDNNLASLKKDDDDKPPAYKSNNLNQLSETLKEKIDKNYQNFVDDIKKYMEGVHEADEQLKNLYNEYEDSKKIIAEELSIHNHISGLFIENIVNSVNKCDNVKDAKEYVIHKLNLSKGKKDIWLNHDILVMSDLKNRDFRKREDEIIKNILNTMPKNMDLKIKGILTTSIKKEDKEKSTHSIEKFKNPYIIINVLSKKPDDFNSEYYKNFFYKTGLNLKQKGFFKEKTKIWDNDKIWKKSLFCTKNKDIDFAETFKHYHTDTELLYYLSAVNNKNKKWTQPGYLKKFSSMVEIYKHKDAQGRECTYDFKIKNGKLVRRSLPVIKKKINGYIYSLPYYENSRFKSLKLNKE